MLTNTGITIFNAFSDKKSKKIVYVPHYIDAVWFHADQNGRAYRSDVLVLFVRKGKGEKEISEEDCRIE